MLAEFFFYGLRRIDAPYRAHLFVRLFNKVLRPLAFAHCLVIKRMLRFRIFSCPYKRLMACGEVSAAKVGRGVGLVPRNVVEQLVFRQLQGEAAGIDRMVRPADPDRARRLQDLPTRGDPSLMECKVSHRAFTLVPFSLIYTDALARVTGKPVVGKVVGRIGKDHIDGIGLDIREKIEAVSEVKLEIFALVVWFHPQPSASALILSDYNDFSIGSQ